MSCPKNIIPRHFLFWNWTVEGEHDYVIIRVGKFMDSCSDFQVSYWCNICGCMKERHFVEMEELIREGFTAGELNKVSKFNSIHR